MIETASACIDTPATDPYSDVSEGSPVFTPPESFDEPLVIIPCSLTETDDFSTGSTTTRDHLAAYCHTVFRAQAYNHRIAKKRLPREQYATHDRRSDFLPASVPQKRFELLIDRNAISKTFAKLHDAGMVEKTCGAQYEFRSEGCTPIAAAKYKLTKAAFRSGFTCHVTETTTLTDNLSLLADGHRMLCIDEPFEVEVRLFNDLKQVTVDWRSAIREAQRLPLCKQLAALEGVLCFAMRQVQMSKDLFGGRLHTPLSNLAKEMRQFLRFQDQPLMNADVRNSQVTLLAGVMRQKCDSSEVNDFCELAFSGKFYEEVQKHSGLTEREDAKESVFAFIFCNQKYEIAKAAEAAHEFFNKRFPAVLSTIEGLKHRDYKRLARELQKLEREVVIDDAVCELARRIPQSRFIGTIHDSIVTLVKDSAEAVACLTEAFDRRGMRAVVAAE